MLLLLTEDISLHAQLFFSIFDVMKGIRPHLIFWLFYWALIACLEYFWLDAFVAAWSENKKIIRAFYGSFFYIIPHLAFAYYLVYFGLARMVQEKRFFFKSIGIILLPYLLAILSIILLARQLVLPYIYGNIIVPDGFFVEPQKFLSIMIETALPAGLLVAIQFVNSQLVSKEREKQLLKDKLTTELQLLKNQMNPHFLFNTLNNIYALTRKKSDQAPEAVLKLSELLSFMLYESGSNTITIEREIAFLEDYIAIQQIRYTDQLTLTFTKELDNPAQQIAPLLLLPLVENAFKHGASENQYASFIHLHLRVKNGELLFEMENSFEQSDLNKQPVTIGLSNTSRQLELLYGEQRLTVNNANNIFKVQLFINLNSYGKV